jgi:chemotaxis protein methyltransferase CheR
LSSIVQDRAYPRLKDQLIAWTGLAFYADRDKLLGDVIGGRISDLGLRGCSSYAEFLADGKKGRSEMDTLIAQLTIGETSFFRDERVFAAIRDIILPDIVRRNQASRQLRIWSAGCASGAEPYSLAIMLTQAFADRIAGWNVGIYATDLNRSGLVQAAKGEFRAWALHATSEQMKRECFSKEGLLWTIHPRYKEWISFHYMNMADSELLTPFPPGTSFDLILCRNVMIYFAPEVNSRLLGLFHRSLDDGGWLVVGASECSPQSFQAFRAVTAPGARLYQKTAPPGGRKEGAPEVTPKLYLPRPVAAVQPLPKPPQPVPADGADVQGLRQLVDRGDWQGAAEYARRLLSRDKLNPEVHFYRALVFESLGTVGGAERCFRRAIYLDRNFALAHYHLGLSLKRDGQMRAAARSFGNVLKVLAGRPDHAPVTSGPGVTVPELRELAKIHLEKSGGS